MLSSDLSRKSLCFDFKLVVVVAVIGYMETRSDNLSEPDLNKVSEWINLLYLPESKEIASLEGLTLWCPEVTSQYNHWHRDA